ncbi:MAG: CvpA family protein [Thiobacillaceae bacterium]
MNGLDLLVLGVMVISAAVGVMRGLVREVFSLGAWVLAFAFAKSLAPFVAPMVPGVESEALRHFAAIVLVFVVILVAASLSGAVLSGMVKWIGLAFYDKFMGLVFGALRGGVIVLLLTLLAGLTAFPHTRLWQEAWLREWLESGARMVMPWLPSSLVEHIRY